MSGWGDYGVCGGEAGEGASVGCHGCFVSLVVVVGCWLLVAPLRAPCGSHVFGGQ